MLLRYTHVIVAVALTVGGARGSHQPGRSQESTRDLHRNAEPLSNLQLVVPVVKLDEDAQEQQGARYSAEVSEEEEPVDDALSKVLKLLGVAPQRSPRRPRQQRVSGFPSRGSDQQLHSDHSGSCTICQLLDALKKMELQQLLKEESELLKRYRSEHGDQRDKKQVGHGVVSVGSDLEQRQPALGLSEESEQSEEECALCVYMLKDADSGRRSGNEPQDVGPDDIGVPVGRSPAP